MLRDIVGCKWSLQVLGAVRTGTHRPGELERVLDGISSKVLAERLKKLVRYSILERRSFGEVPPRVEYRFTAFGKRFLALLDAIDRMQGEIDG